LNDGFEPAGDFLADDDLPTIGLPLCEIVIESDEKSEKFVKVSILAGVC
jgi:hypothetical protein